MAYTHNLSQRPLVNQLFDEFATLLEMRIQNFYRMIGGAAEFMNMFIICPYDQDDFDKEYIRVPAKARHFFTRELGIQFTWVELSNIGLRDDMQIVYHLHCGTNFLTDDQDSDTLFITYFANQIEVFDAEHLKYLEQLGDGAYADAIKAIQGEISFGSLMRS